MEQRLQQLLQMESLSPSQFADKMGIQRSGISHILSGRNKPSFDFISKLMELFPSVNTEWLILGKGKPYKDNQVVVEKTVVPLVAEAKAAPEEESQVKSEPGLLFDEPEQTPVESPKPSENKSVEPVLSITQPSENQKIVNEQANCPQKSQGKMVEKVILLYTDGTFEIRP